MHGRPDSRGWFVSNHHYKVSFTDIIVYQWHYLYRLYTCLLHPLTLKQGNSCSLQMEPFLWLIILYYTQGFLPSVLLLLLLRHAYTTPPEIWNKTKKDFYLEFLGHFLNFLYLSLYFCILKFIGFFFGFFRFFVVPFKFTKVTSKSYQRSYWTQKIAKNGPKQHNNLFLCLKVLKTTIVFVVYFGIFRGVITGEGMGLGRRTWLLDVCSYIYYPCSYCN